MESDFNDPFTFTTAINWVDDYAIIIGHPSSFGSFLISLISWISIFPFATVNQLLFNKLCWGEEKIMDKSNYVAPSIRMTAVVFRRLRRKKLNLQIWNFRYVDNMWATKDVDIKTKSYGKNVVSQKGVWKNPQNMVWTQCKSLKGWSQSFMGWSGWWSGLKLVSSCLVYALSSFTLFIWCSMHDELSGMLFSLRGVWVMW